MFCFHSFGKVQDDGYQYCTKCGRAAAAPVKPAAACSHTFEILEVAQRINNHNNRCIGRTYINRCTRCGIIEVVPCMVGGGIW